MFPIPAENDWYHMTGLFHILRKVPGKIPGTCDSNAEVFHQGIIFMQNK
jgi:hypothetical protein